MAATFRPACSMCSPAWAARRVLRWRPIPGIHHLSFTGSPETGTLVAQAAARHHVPVTMELGGKSPQIVFADADLDAALDAVVRGIVQNAGQTCSAGSRLLIQEAVAET